MERIHLINGYRLELLSAKNHKIVEALNEKCADFFILHDGVLPSEKDANEIFTALPPNKNYEDKFVFGLYRPDDELVGIIDIVRDFPTLGEWTLGLMLIDPQERGNGLGKMVHEALVRRALDLGAKSFRIGVVEENKKGFHFWSGLGYKKVKQITMDFKEKTHLTNYMTLQL